MNIEKMDMDVQFEKKKKELKEVREQKKKLLELENQASLNLNVSSNLESQVTDRSKRKLMRELEIKAINIVKGAKRKSEDKEKERIAQLNKQIEKQTTRIAELCTSNNEMSARLQRAECELKKANAELNKLRASQVEHEESLEKMRKLSRQSAEGVDNKLEQMAAQTHNHVTELRSKLELEVAKNADLESKIRNEEDSNICHQSRLTVALGLTESELKDCQEELRSLKATIPSRDAEIEELRKELLEKSKQLESAVVNEQTFLSMQEQIESLTAENEHLESQLENAKSDLNGTLMSLERREKIVLRLERAKQGKATLEFRLRTSLETKEEHLRKLDNLEKLLRILEYGVRELEAESASLKASDDDKSTSSTRSSNGFCNHQSKNISQLQQQIQKLQQELRVTNENLDAERKMVKKVQISLWKKEKEFYDAKHDIRIATSEAKTTEDEKIKTLKEDKQKLIERLRKKERDEEKKAAKLLKEINKARASLAEITKESSRNNMQADSAQRALTQANKQIAELQSSSASSRRELDANRTQIRGNQERISSLKAENERLKLQISKHNDVTDAELEDKIDKLQAEVNSYQFNNGLLKETCTVLEEQLIDYEKLTTDHEIRGNILIEGKMKLKNDLEIAETQLQECKKALNEEKTMRIVAERQIERLQSEFAHERDEQIAGLSIECGNLEYDLSQVKRLLENAKEEARYVKEESSQHLTLLHELKEKNLNLKSNLQESEDLNKELRARVAEIEGIMDEMRQFYQEREVKSDSKCQQQTKLIDHLQLQLEQYSKKKKGVYDKIFGLKQ